MADTNEVLTNQISDLQYLIAAPMVATVNADVYAAKAFVEFIEQYGFEELLTEETEDGDVANDHLGKLKMITFWYSYTQKVIIDGKEATEEKMVSVSLPKISLIPMPILQVNDAKYDFDIRITGIYDNTEVKDTDGDLMKLPTKKRKEKDRIPSVKATYTPLASEANVNQLAPSLVANMKLKINMRQADIPAGISNILNIASEASNSNTKTVEPKQKKNKKDKQDADKQ